jgi:hypothetical protein
VLVSSVHLLVLAEPSVFLPERPHVLAGGSEVAASFPGASARGGGGAGGAPRACLFGPRAR